MNSRKSSANPAQPGQFRIIGGEWRSRRLTFPAVAGLRPTPDRVRETLFNWLAQDIRGATCLDLYCGSGALGLEALSRGAAFCTFIDGAASATKAIEQHLQLLKGQGRVITGELPAMLQYITTPVDVIFLDPPYAIDSHNACLNHLAARSLLNDGCWIYCENASEKPLPALIEGCELHRHKKAGAVQYALFRYRFSSTNAANSL